MVANLVSASVPVELPPLEFHGDLDNNAPPVDTDADVIVHGSVRDSAKIKTRGSVRIEGDVHNAHLSADGDAEVTGGISGEASDVRIGGDLHSRYIISATLRCAGSVNLDVEMVNTKLFCGGQLLMPTGAIAASTVHALQGLHCRAAGSDRGVACELIVGVDPDLNRMLVAHQTEIEKLHKLVLHVRRGLQPLMDHMKQLSAEQKEKATELLYQADEAEQRCKDLQAGVVAAHERYKKLRAPTVRFEERAHHGTSIRFPGSILTLESDLTGPITLESEVHASDERLYKIDADGHRAPIYSRAAVDEARVLFRKLLAPIDKG